MKFTKYLSLGDYHWRFYYNKSFAKKNVDFRVAWVKEKNVLDIGAGDGLVTYLLGAKGIDNEESGVKIAQEKGADVILGEADNLPFADNSFESAIMFDSIEHFEDPAKAVKEARRVITKFLYVITPERTGELGAFHVQEWLLDELNEFICSLGFSVEESIVRKGTLFGKYKKI